MFIVAQACGGFGSGQQDREARRDCARGPQNFPRAPVFPVEGARDRFFYDFVKAELQFERDASGKATTLVLHQDGVFRMERVD